MLDFHHSTGPAPAYAIESDSEDDQWADEPGRGVERRSAEPSAKGRDDDPRDELEWQPAPPAAPLAFRGQAGLLVLVGDAGLLVCSGLPQDLKQSALASFVQLGQHLLLSPSAPFALAPRHVPLHLQTALARKLLADTRPPSLTIVAAYQAPTYIPSSDNFPVRFLASSLSAPPSSAPHALESLGCHHFQVPNLIKGFEAALMIQVSFSLLTTLGRKKKKKKTRKLTTIHPSDCSLQAKILQIESTMILLPAISIPHDDKSSASIPSGQYDFSSGGSAEGLEGAGLAASLLGLDDPELRRTLKNVIDRCSLGSLHLPAPASGSPGKDPRPQWTFPEAIDPAIRLAFRKKLGLDHQLKPNTASTDPHHQSGLMYI
jgi:hypothetical protein